MYRKDLQLLDDALDEAKKELNAKRALISGPVDTAIEALKQLLEYPVNPLYPVAKRLIEIRQELQKGFAKVGPIPQGKEIAKMKEPLKALENKIMSIPQTTDEKVTYDWEVRPLVSLKIQRFDEDLRFLEQDFRVKQWQRLTGILHAIEEKFGNRLMPGKMESNPISDLILETTSSIANMANDLTNL